MDSEHHTRLERGAKSLEAPPLVRQAIRHVRAHIPGVDRVVFWGDGRWAFMTGDLVVPSFDGLHIDTSLLEDAAGELPDAFPHAFQLHPDHQS